MEYRHEFEIKLERIRMMLKEEQLYGCYIKRQDNFAWLTCGKVNYVAVGDFGNCGLLVTQEKLYAITNNIEAPRMREEEKLEEMGFSILEGVWHQTDFEKQEIQRICQKQPVGYDHRGDGADLSSCIQQLRFSLTEEEVSRYQEGGKLASRLIEETAASLRPGDTELTVVGRAACLAREAGLDVISLFCGSDERIYRYRHAIPTEKVIRERVQMGGNLRYKGLVICCTRYVNFIPVSEELKKQYIDNVRTDCTMIANSIPGESYQTPFLAGKKAYEELGYGQEFEKHHQGGPIGYTARDYRIDFSHHGVIAPNQGFCWNPSITGTKSEDTVIATVNGPLFISSPCLFPAIELKVCGQSFKRPYILEKY